MIPQEIIDKLGLQELNEGIYFESKNRKYTYKDLFLFSKYADKIEVKFRYLNRWRSITLPESAFLQLSKNDIDKLLNLEFEKLKKECQI